MKSILTFIKPLNKETGYFFIVLFFITANFGTFGAISFFIVDYLISYLNIFIESYLEDKKKEV